MQLIIALLVALVASASAFAPRKFSASPSFKSMVRFQSRAQLQVSHEVSLFEVTAIKTEYRYNYTSIYRRWSQSHHLWRISSFQLPYYPSLPQWLLSPPREPEEWVYLNARQRKIFFPNSSLIFLSYVIHRLSVLTMADSFGPPFSLPSLSSHCTFNGPVSKSQMTSSTATRRDARVKRSRLSEEKCTYLNYSSASNHY